MKKYRKKYDETFSDKEKEIIKTDYVVNLLSLKEVCEKYDIHSKTWLKKLIGKNIRSLSESHKIAHQKFPNSFKHNSETKEKIRKKRIEWMKNNTEKTAWRLKNMSYPEKCFQELIKKNELDKKYLIYREFSVFPYFIDFAFVDEKVAIEIDGSQHLEDKRKMSDKIKDELLISQNWRVLRFTSNEVMFNASNVNAILLDFLGDKKTKSQKVGVLKSPKKREKVTRDEDGYSEGEKMRAFKQRKVKRPSKEELLFLIKNKTFTQIGKDYGVSDNAIRKWCKSYGLPYKKKDILLI